MRAVALVDAHGAITAEGTSIVKLLVEAGADLELRAGHGMFTPIGHALNAGNLEAVALLRQAGAELGPEDEAASGDREAVEQLLTRDPTTAVRHRVSGTGHFTASVGLLDRVAASGVWRRGVDLVPVASLLLEAGASPGKRVDEHGLPGHAAGEAAFTGNADVLRVLLRHGAVAEDVFDLALQGHHQAVLDVLDGHPLDVDGPGDVRLGTRRLHEEARWGRATNVVWLLERGATPNVLDASGRTVLHHAARRGFRIPWFEEVIGFGVDPRVRDVEGFTAADVARARRKARLADWLDAGT